MKGSKKYHTLSNHCLIVEVSALHLMVVAIKVTEGLEPYDNQLMAIENEVNSYGHEVKAVDNRSYSNL